MENAALSPLHDDPEIAALLAFTPVPRKNKRHDGWTDEIQRGYILGLAVTGNVDRAAQSVASSSRPGASPRRGMTKGQVLEIV